MKRQPAQQAQADMTEERRRAFLRQNSFFLGSGLCRDLENRKTVDLDDPSALLGSRRLGVGLRASFQREMVCVGYKGNLKTFKVSTP